METRRLVAVALLPVAGGAMTLATAGTAAAAPNHHASCVAQLTTNPEFGPPGRAEEGPVGGRIVSAVAHAHGNPAFCARVLFGLFEH